MDSCKNPRENVRILDPEIYVPPGPCILKAKGGPCASTHFTGMAQDHQGVPGGIWKRSRLGAEIGRANHSV